MLDKKQIWVIFLFEFKMGYKVEQTTLNISNTFGPGTANECTVQWWFKKFCKGDESLEDEEHSGRPSEVDSDQLRGSLKLTLLKLHEKLLKNSASTILQPCGIWSKLERWKSSVSGCLMSWLQIEEVVILKCHLILHNKNAPFLDWIVAWEDWIVAWEDRIVTEKKLQST